MSSPYSRAPHATSVPGNPPEAPNAALLIDFDNVTMGMRSDLSKELRNLLNSDMIKGKVTVQRAYADWRRYPQYIVPLSENSVDLIFAPAYGSSKKNATDIRMAIDAIELVFIRPEIGTFILLTGDSDFSSVVLKLKEYGKYVIGVGIQESSSDILVQNCDEYYSYTSLTGLRKTTDSDNKPVDPWVLVEQAVARMSSRNDVMRSDRLKQVMIEIDPSFDEGNFGFSKFSRFVSEAGSRDLVSLRKLENGQYEVTPSARGKKETDTPDKDARGKAPGRGRGKAKEKDDRAASGRAKASPKKEAQAKTPTADAPKGDARGRGPAEGSGDGVAKGTPKVGSGDGPRAKDEADPLKSAYGILQEALGALDRGDGAGVRDSDLKRKMLILEPSFDEGELGFGKFSRFLRQAHDHEIVDLEKGQEGTYQVSPRAKSGEKRVETLTKTEQVEPEAKAEVKAPSTKAPVEVPSRGGVGVRRGTKTRRGQEGPPPFLEGQVVPGSGRGESTPDTPPVPETEGGKPKEKDTDSRSSTSRTPRTRRGAGRTRAQEELPLAPVLSDEPVALGALGLPADGPALIRYLTNSYKGVGQKTAERLVNEFGSELFEVLHREPERLGSVLRADRVGQLLEGWKADLARRLDRTPAEGNPKEESTKGDASKPRPRTRKGTRGRSRGGSTGTSEDPS